MRDGYLVLSLLLAFLLLAGCTETKYTSLKDLKSNPEKYLGEKVVLNGTVKESVKLGKISGFQLQSDAESIYVSSESLPAEGKTVVVQGTLMNEVLVGYYVLAKDIQTKN